MITIRELHQQIPDPTLSIAERVRLRCQLAKQFEKTGNYDAACGAMHDLWPGFGSHPKLDTLDRRTSGEVLLRVGVLTGWIGSIRLIKGSQKMAENLISESIAIFESLSEVKKIAEAQIEIGYCYVREGELDAARGLYMEALARLDDRDGDLKALALLRSAIVELQVNRLKDSLNTLKAATTLFEASNNHVLRGSFHNQFALVLRNLGTGESGPKYLERVLSEYATAIFHFEQAGHARYQGLVENNVAMALLQLERFAEAHEHLDRAQALLTTLDDTVHLARVEDSRARVFLAEGAVAKAEQILRAAIRTVEKGDQPSALSEVLTTYGIALARLKRSDEARAMFEQAMGIAERIGDLENASVAVLSLIEYLAEQLTDDDLYSMLELARRFLNETQNTALLNRFTECTYRALSRLYSARPDWANFSLSEALRHHEARFVQMALEDSGGSVTKAAGLLGLAGHQSLTFILNRRHPELLAARTPVRRRRKSAFRVRNQ